MTAWGWVLIVVGAVVGVIGLFFDVVAYGAVNNIGLIGDRIVVVLFAGGLFLAGVILVAAGSIRFALLFPEEAKPKPTAGPPEPKPGYTVNARD